MSDITIVATTYLPPGQEGRRLDAFVNAMESWRNNLFNTGRINLVIADDGSEHGWFMKMISAANEMWRNGFILYGQQQRHGVGASLNSGLKSAFAQGNEIILHAVDDWELLAPLDITPWVAFMEDPKYDVGMVRFFPHPDLEGTFRHIPPHGWAVVLERHHYVFGLRPCLWHKRFFDAMGYFKEDVSALECEDDFNRRFITRPSAVEGERIWLALPELWRPIETFSLADMVPA